MSHLTLRELLIQRVLQTPPENLATLQRFLDELEDRASLECGDASPLSIAAKPLSIPKAVARNESGSAANQSGDASPHSKWPRAPLHRLSEHGTYIVTAGTLHKEHSFRGDDRLRMLHDKLLQTAVDFGWQLEAWAVFSNHYHFVAHSSAKAEGLDEMLKHLHGETSTKLNQLDDQPGRQVWFNFWETQLTYEKSYLTRLNYVHQNALRHGLVKVANQYPWCSAAWFERAASPAQVKTIYGFKIDRVKVIDDF